MTALRTPFDRGANALIRAGADLRAAGARLGDLTADLLDEPLLLGADGFAALVDPDPVDDRLAAALARLAAGGTPAASAHHGRTVDQRPAPAEAPPSAAGRDPERDGIGPRATGRRDQDRASRQGERTGLGAGPSVGDRAPPHTPPHTPAHNTERRVQPLPPRPGQHNQPTTARTPRAGVPDPGTNANANAASSAPDRATVAPQVRPPPDASPATIAGAARADAPSRVALPTTGPVRLEDGLPPAVRRALLAGDRRALDAAVARAATVGAPVDQPAGPLADALSRIDHALARIRGGAARPAAPPSAHQSVPVLSDAPAPGAPRAQPSTTPTPSPPPSSTPAPILIGTAPSGLRRLAERAGAIPAPGGVRPHPEASPPPRTAPAVDLTGANDRPRADAVAGSLDDDARFAERLADLLRREARAQGIGGRGR